MPNVSFTGLFIVAVVAFLIPLLIGLTPARRLPTVAFEIVAGILLGPSVLGWVRIDLPIQILSFLGLAFLLFLAGLEVEPNRLKGRLLQSVVLGLLLSIGLALVVGYGLFAVGLVKSPLFITIVLLSTSFSVIVPFLKDTGEDSTELGQYIIASAMIAEFGSIILLSLFFSGEASNTGIKLILLSGFALLAIVFTFVVLRLERWMLITDVLFRLQDTTAQIRIRGSYMLLAAFAVLAEVFGLDVILGTFIAGVILKLIDQDRSMTHPQFRLKLDALGFGIFVPAFFVTSGLRFNLPALLANPAAFLLVPIFLGALLLIRGVPALLYLPRLGTRSTIVAGLLQSTSLSFIVLAVQIGLTLGQITQATGAALVATGLLSVLIFPILALMFLRSNKPIPAPVQEQV